MMAKTGYDNLGWGAVGSERAPLSLLGGNHCSALAIIANQQWVWSAKPPDFSKEARILM